MTEAQIAGIAGEHYVAHKIAMLGFLPTLVRQRTPRVDLLVSGERGRSAAVQIKSAFHATRECVDDAGHSDYELRFPLGFRSIQSSSDAAFFCFVDLKRLTPMATPDVYVVPAAVLKQEYEGVYFRKYAQMHHQRPWRAMQQYRNNWNALAKYLEADAAEPVTRSTPATELHGLPREWTGFRGRERASSPARLLDYGAGAAG